MCSGVSWELHGTTAEADGGRSEFFEDEEEDDSVSISSSPSTGADRLRPGVMRGSLACNVVELLDLPASRLGFSFGWA